MKWQAVEHKTIQGGEWLLVVQELAALSGLNEEALRQELCPFFQGLEGPFSLEQIRMIMVKYLDSFGRT